MTINFERGVFATLDTSWSRPAKTFPTWGDVTLGVVGTKGVAELDMFAQQATLYDDTAGRIAYQAWGSGIDGGMVAAFVDAVTKGEPGILATGIDGLRAVEVVEAAYASASSHKVEKVRRR